MARALRIEFPEAQYHVTARSNERRKIFRDEDDRRLFLKRLKKNGRAILCRDGSSVVQIIKRLEKKSEQDQQLAARKRHYETLLSIVKS